MTSGMRSSLLAGVAGLGALALGLAVWLGWAQIAPAVAEAWSALWATLEQANPVVFFGAFAVLTLGPVPASAFYLSAAPLFGMGVALLGILCALAVNLTLAHWATSGVLRPLLVRIVEQLGYRVPAVSPASETHVIVLVRVAPGIPYFAQTLILGLAGTRYRPYLVISLPIQMGWALGFVLLGESAMQGSVGVAIAAVSILIVSGLATRVLRRRMAATEEVALELEQPAEP